MVCRWTYWERQLVGVAYLNVPVTPVLALHVTMEGLVM